MKGPYTGNMMAAIEATVTNVMRRNRGAQLGLGGAPRAYRVRYGRGEGVLCDRHVDLERAAGRKVAVTGGMLGKEACDLCKEGK